MKFRENTEKLEVGRGEIDEEIEEMIKKINEGIIGKKKRKNGTGRKKWWDGEYKRKKKEVRRILKEWKKGRVGKEEYIEGKKEYRSLCERKKEERNEELIKEAREAKTQKQVWEVINKERRRRVEVNRKWQINEGKR